MAAVASQFYRPARIAAIWAAKLVVLRGNAIASRMGTLIFVRHINPPGDSGN
jgi:hypothetical protein